MKIAILSDIHDRLDHLEAILTRVSEEGPERLFFLGDFCAPFSLAALAEGFKGPIDAVFGNNDGDEYLLCKIAAGFPQVTLHGHLAELDLGGRKIALHHYPDVALRLAESGAYDAVFSGHDHERYLRLVGDTIWANPGEIMGRLGAPGFGIYESEDNRFEHIILKA